MEEIEKTDNEQKRTDKPWLFPKGQSGNPNGRPKGIKMTDEEKEIKRATKELVKDYIDKLAGSLPEISPILISKAMEGDIIAIKEINDRVMGKSISPIDITTGGESFFRPSGEDRIKALKALEDIK
jgi:hypothetical protein